MGEVVRFNFGGDRKKEPEEVVPQAEEPAAAHNKEKVLDTFEDAKFLIQNIDRVDVAGERTEKILDFYTELNGFVYDEPSIQLRMQELRKNSVENLINLLESSTEFDWRSRPSFYVALVTEYNERTKQIKDLIGDDE